MPLFIFNYLTDIFFENFDRLKSKFELVVFELYNYLYTKNNISMVNLKC